MRTGENAVWLVDDDEAAPAPAKAATGSQGEEEEPRSVWERVAIAATIFIGFQFALLAFLGL
jgi:predicted cobalt transporter CbtA